MYNSPAGYLQDPLFSCLSIKIKSFIWRTLWVDSCRVICCERQSCGAQKDNSLIRNKEYLRYTVVGKKIFPILHLFMFLLYMLLCNIWKSQEWLTSSAVTSSKYDNYLKRTKGKLSNTGHKLYFLGALGEKTAVMQFY